MKTRYKHIHFEEGGGPKADHPLYHCKNNRTASILGVVFYFKPWKKYVFEGRTGCVFDVSCLTDIIDFMNQLGA